MAAIFLSDDNEIHTVSVDIVHDTYEWILYRYTQAEFLTLLTFIPWTFSKSHLKSNDVNRLWHDDVIKWKHFPPYWPFKRGIHQSPVNSPHRCQWRGALMFSFICALTGGCANNRDAGDLRLNRAHYDVTVMIQRNHRCFMTRCHAAHTSS